VKEPTAQRGVGAVYGTSRTRPFDRWFRYPAGFSPDALAAAVEAIGTAPSHVAEPFCGTATAAGALSRDSHMAGIEAHPLIAELGSLKLRTPRAGPTSLRRAAEEIAERACMRGDVETDAEHPMVRRCFTEPVLRELVSLRAELERPPRSSWRTHLKWALLGTLRDVASVKVGWPYQRPSVSRAAPHRDPSARFLARAEMMAADLETGPPLSGGSVTRGDARRADSWRRAARGHLFDACVTSPPYLNNFDYADATRLELYFLEAGWSWGEMCRRVRSGMLVATTQQSSRPRSGRALEQVRRHPTVGPEVERLHGRLVEERARRARGKEYDQVLPTYFADMALVLTHLRDHTTQGARCAWVIGDSAPYGVYVDTPKLIGNLAEDLGFKVRGDTKVRSRGARWRTNGTRHQVALSERLLVFERC
jgi:hypothetical protein